MQGKKRNNVSNAPKFYTSLIILIFFLVRQPPVGQDLLIYEVSRSHTTTHHIRQDSSGREINPSQRPLPDNTQHSQPTERPCPQWDSNPQSEQASSRRPTRSRSVWKREKSLASTGVQIRDRREDVYVLRAIFTANGITCFPHTSLSRQCDTGTSTESCDCWQLQRA